MSNREPGKEEAQSVESPESSIELDYKVQKTDSYAITPVFDHIQEVIDSVEANEEGLFDPLSIQLGVAPHIISIAGFAFLATHKMCSVHSEVLWNRSAESTREHRIHFPELTSTGEQEDFIRQLLGKLNLQFVHKITIKNIFNHSGQISYPTMAVAVWKSLSSTEFGICLKQNLIEILLKFDLKVEEQEAVLQTVMMGSELWIQLKPEQSTDDTEVQSGSILRENDDNRISIDHIKNLSFLFARTNLHNSDFIEKLLTNESDFLEFKQNVKNVDYMEEQNFIGKAMEQYSKTRVAQYGSNKKQKYTCLKIEIDSYTALKNFRETNRVAGVQIQQGGILIVMEKNHFMKENVLETIASDIANGFREEVSKITFDIIKFSDGPMLVNKDDALNLKREIGYEFNVISIEDLQTDLKRTLEEVDDHEEGSSSKKQKIEEDQEVEQGSPHDDTHDDA